MVLDEFFTQQVAEDPSLADEFKEAEAELRLALETAREREAQGLTQVQVAHRMRISQSVVGRFEAAGRTPTTITLWKLAAALNVGFVLGPDHYVSVLPWPSVSACLAAGGSFFRAKTGSRSLVYGVPHNVGSTPRQSEPIEWTVGESLGVDGQTRIGEPEKSAALLLAEAA